MRKLFFSLIVVAGLVPLLPARALDAFEQNARLGRGVNIIGYDPLWHSRDQARFQERYFKMLTEAGFTSVRINLHAFRQMGSAPDYALPDKWWDTLAWGLNGASAQGLLAILD